MRRCPPKAFFWQGSKLGHGSGMKLVAHRAVPVQRGVEFFGFEKFFI
jgi:hypothetical protein